MAIYINDLFITGPDRHSIRDFKARFSDYFYISNLSFCVFYLGMRVSRDREKRFFILNQEAYVDKLLDDFNIIKINPIFILISPDSKLPENKNNYKINKI